MGATEIGQGADTVFTQMAAEVLGIDTNNVHIMSTQDTDISPFDLGAFASRQTYVAGKAIKQTAGMLKDKILRYAEKMLWTIRWRKLDISDGEIVDKNTTESLISLNALAVNAFYDRESAVQLSAESTVNCKENTLSFGATFVEIEVDTELWNSKNT